MQTKIHNASFRAKAILRPNHVLILTLFLLTIIAGFVLPFTPEKVQYTMILMFPAIIVCLVILRNPYSGIFLFFFYSYLRPYDFIPALGALRLTMLIEVVTLVAWVLKIIKTKNKIEISTLSWCFLAFMGAIGITVMTAENNHFAYETFFSMSIFFVIFIIATNVVDSVNRLNKIVWLLLLIHFYFALKGINTFIGGEYMSSGQLSSGRVGRGYIGDENDFALVINTMIPFAFFGLLYFKGKVKVLCVILLVTFVLSVISSFSRGGLVGLASILIYCILNSKRKLLSFGVVISLIVVMFLFAPSSYWAEANSIQNIDRGTADTRIRYWKAAFRMFIDYPIVGVGAGNGGVHLPKYIQGGTRDSNTEWGRAFHGLFPQVIAELGMLGSFFYFAMIIIAFKLLYRIKNRKVGEGGATLSLYMTKSITGSLIAYFTCSTFLSTAYYPHLWTLYTFTVILALNQGMINANQQGEDDKIMADNKLILE